MDLTVYGNYDWIRGYYKDQDVFCLAGGPSLKGFDFDRLHGKNKIVISHVSKFIEMEDQDILVFLDGSVRQTIRQDLTVQNHKTVIGRNVGLEPKGQLARIKYAKDVQLDPKHGFWGGYATGHFAISIALSAMAKNIYLLGFDCTAHGNDVNFYDTMKTKGYKRWGSAAEGAERYGRMVKGFDKFKDFGNIYNCSPISIIKTFKRVDIDRILPIIVNPIRHEQMR